MTEKCPTLPFSNIKITPSYGSKTCSITWTLASKYNSEKYAVNLYKSRDGYTDWFKLNKTPIEATLGLGFDKKTLTDIQFKNKGQVINWHYKLELVQVYIVNGNEISYKPIIQTPPFGIYCSLNSAEYSTLRSMLENETLTQDNINVYILRPKGLSGKSIYSLTNNRNYKTVDYLTQEHSGVSTDDESYGQTILCGYSNPIATEISIQTIQNKHTDDPNGQGTLTSKQIVFEGFSYPRLVKGDIIVIPETDERYVFEQYQSENLFKGVIPFTYIGIAKLLPRNDMAYKFNLNDLESCCI
jgi:hypothetical protein